MTKRKPDSVRVIRFELQDKERELVEQAIFANATSSIIDSMSKMDITTGYMWLTVLEGLGLVNTPVPTIGDGSIEDAFASFMKSLGLAKDATFGGGVEIGPYNLTIGDILRYYAFGEMPTPNQS